MERNLLIGNHSTCGGVRAFLDRIVVLSTYLPLFPPIFNVTYQELTNQEKQLIDQMKKSKQVPLEMPLEGCKPQFHLRGWQAQTKNRFPSNKPRHHNQHQIRIAGNKHPSDE
jgi:hypothetical protein